MINQQKKVYLLAGLFFILSLLGIRVLFAAPGQGEPGKVVIDEKLGVFHLAKSLEFYEDQSRKLTLNDIISPAYQSKFQPLNRTRLHFGYTRSTIWCRFATHNPTGSEIAWYFGFFGECDFITLYVPGPGGYTPLAGGDLESRESRWDSPFDNFFFLKEQPGSRSYYFKISSNNPIILFPKALSQERYHHEMRGAFAFVWLIVGIMLALVIYNTFIFFTVREKCYLYLVIFISSYTLMLLYETGVLKFSPSSPPMVAYILSVLFIGFSFFSLIHLTRSFLNTGRHFPQFDRVLFVCSWVILPMPVLYLVLPVLDVNRFLSILSITLILLIITSVVLSAVRKVKGARFYLLSSAFFLVGILIMFADFIGLIPANFPHHTGSLSGFIIMVLLLSLGITNKISAMRNERFKALEAREQSEKKLLSIFENATEGIYQFSPELGVMEANPAVAKIFGFNSPSELKRLDCIKDYLDADLPTKMMKVVQSNGGVRDLETSAFRRDGKKIHISMSTQPVVDEKGKLLYIQGFIRDITEVKDTERLLRMAKEELEQRVERRTAQLSKINEELKQEIEEREKAEKALKQSEERHRLLIETMNEGFALLDENFNIKYVNPKLYEMFGFELGEIGEQPVMDFLDDKNKEIMKSQMTVRREGKREPYEIEWLGKNGKRFITIVSPHPIFDENGNFAGSSAVLTDITALKNAEEQLKKAKEAAEKANRTKSEFLANMSHEIRTPLNSVMGFTDLLAPLVVDEKQRRYLDSIKSSGKSLLMLINDILDLSRIEAGKLDIHYEAVNPYTIFNELKQIFSIKIEEKGLEFISDMAPDVPQGLLLDEVRLRQILFNLIGNAVKFTDEGYIKLSVKQIYTKKDKSSLDLVIAVEDTGIGIPPQSRQKIFDAFRQQDGQSNKKYGGTGLGLAITRRLVEMMGGEIHLTSEVGKGSIFEIRLRDVAVAATSPIDDQQGGIDYDHVVFMPATILVVDDAEANRELVKEFLVKKEFTVIEAVNGKEAVQMAKEHKPGLILMDIKMPVMDGYEANRLIQEDDQLKDIPVVALTASAMKGDKHKMLEEGFDGMLHKPVQVSDLFEEIGHFIPYEEKEIKAVFRGDDTGMIPVIIDENLEEAINYLENQGMELWQSAGANGFFNEISDFGRQMKKKGREFGMPRLKEFGKQLVQYAEHFDIENMNALITGFPHLVEQLKIPVPVDEGKI